MLLPLRPTAAAADYTAQRAQAGPERIEAVVDWATVNRKYQSIQGEGDADQSDNEDDDDAVRDKPEAGE